MVRLYSSELGLEKVIFELQNGFFWIVKYWLDEEVGFEPDMQHHKGCHYH